MTVQRVKMNLSLESPACAIPSLSLRLIRMRFRS